jgi:hypothetical protein
LYAKVTLLLFQRHAEPCDLSASSPCGEVKQAFHNVNFFGKGMKTIFIRKVFLGKNGAVDSTTECNSAFANLGRKFL